MGALVPSLGPSLVPSVACAAPSERLVRALAPLGLMVRRGAEGARVCPEDLAALLAMRAGDVALISGPSGCGKSSLVRGLARAARARGVRAIDAGEILGRAPGDRPIIDLFSLSLERTQRVLSLAGLGEGALWARSAGELSEGQRARLGLAMAMARTPAGADSFVLLDEFCSTLDRVTARNIARTLRAWGRSMPRARIVCATAHEDLVEALRPDLVITPEVG